MFAMYHFPVQVCFLAEFPFLSKCQVTAAISRTTLPVLQSGRWRHNTGLDCSDVIIVVIIIIAYIKKQKSQFKNLTMQVAIWKSFPGQLFHRIVSHSSAFNGRGGNATFLRVGFKIDLMLNSNSRNQKLWGIAPGKSFEDSSTIVINHRDSFI